MIPELVISNPGPWFRRNDPSYNTDISNIKLSIISREDLDKLKLTVADLAKTLEAVSRNTSALGLYFKLTMNFRDLTNVRAQV